MSLQVHEICRGAHRAVAVKDIRTWLALCPDCHSEMDDYSIWPISKQLFIKKWRDPQNYDRAAVNTIRGREPEAITEEEVDQWMNSKNW